MIVSFCRLPHCLSHRFSSLCCYLFNNFPHSSLCSSGSFVERSPNSYDLLVIKSAKFGDVEETLRHFCKMNCLGIKPTQSTLCTILNSCSKALNHCVGSQIHAQIIRMGHENLFLSSALVDLYAKCGELMEAKKIFDGMKEHDHVSWTSIIAGLSQNGCGQEALVLFKEMLRTKTKPNCFTYSSIVSASNELESSLELAMLLHAHVIKLGLEISNYVISSLIDCYMKCGETNLASSLFGSAPAKDVILYNVMISGFAQNSMGEEAWSLFKEMQENGNNPTHFTCSSLLNACGSLAVLQQGKQLQSLVTKLGLDRNVFVVSSLVDMYMKCGSVDEAYLVFDHTVEKNNILWTSMITGYAQNGRGVDGLNLFDQMLEAGVIPDHVCFTGVLTACVHSGLLEEGITYFNLMKTKYGLVPELDQFSCLIDLYGRKGHLRKAKELMDCMRFEPNAVMWSSFLSSCRIYGETELGKEAAMHLFEMEPFSAAPYVSLANMYGEAGVWHRASELRKLVKCKGLMRRAGCSWIEVDHRVHVFSARDVSHLRSHEICDTLNSLTSAMKDIGYVSMPNYILHDINTEDVTLNIYA